MADPRIPQIAVLTTLLVYGLASLDFEVAPAQVAATLATCQLTQLAFSRWNGLRFDPRSALISSLSLCLLLRTQHLGWAVGLAFFTIASKFVLRWKGRHIWNPTCLGLVVGLLLTDQVWVSGGQWGSFAVQGLFMACLASLVLRRSPKSDITWAFLLLYGGLVLGRSWFLSEPWAIPLHRLQNGAVLLFAFFMVSDPRTIPDARAGRMVFALLVALGAFFVQYVRFDTNGFLWALAALAPVTLVLNRLFAAPQFHWPQRPQPVRVARAPSGGIPCS